MSYLLLTKSQREYVDWITSNSMAAAITRFPAPGSGTSPLADRLLDGHNSENMTPEELEIIFCWIDMAIPHAATFSDGMTPQDSANYDGYVAKNRTKHAEWEVGNMKEFVAAGQ